MTLDQQGIQEVGRALCSWLGVVDSAAGTVPGLAGFALDLLAVFAGHKCSALTDMDEVSERRWLALAEDLPPYATVTCRFWVVEEEIAGLPGWYGDEVVAARARTTVRLVWAADRKLPAVPPARAAAEAELLSYPVCCVRDYYRRRRLYHRFMGKRIRHFAGTDETRARTYVASEVALSPATAGERAAFAAATNSVLAPFTGIAMCRTCAVTANSPARRLSAAYAELAELSGLVDLLPAEGTILSGPSTSD